MNVTQDGVNAQHAFCTFTTKETLEQRLVFMS